MAGREGRKAIEETTDYGIPIPLQVSIGYAMVDDENTDIMEAQKTAETNMYREKLNHGISEKSSIIKTFAKSWKPVTLSHRAIPTGHKSLPQSLPSC